MKKGQVKGDNVLKLRKDVYKLKRKILRQAKRAKVIINMDKKIKEVSNRI